MTRTLPILLAIVTSLVVAPVLAQAQTTKRAYRVAWVSPTPLAEVSPNFDAFRDEMRQRGYVESENVSYERRFAEPSPEGLRGVLNELTRLNVDVIVAVAQPTVQAAQQATITIPIVMFGVGDPVATGIVASLARPGSNITGLTQFSPELSGKRLELLKETLPRMSRVAVLWNPTNPSNEQQIKVIQGVAEKLAIELQLLEVSTPQHLEGAFLSGARGGAEALLTLDDLLIFTQRNRIVDLAAKYRLPAVSGWPQFTEAGGMMSYGADFLDMATRAAAFVDKILKGAKPADLPVEQPTKFELMINLKTGRALGLTIPQSLLFRADKVIE
jgi:putative tryptophan/tyrosine transport system substrate-binding protein